MEQDVIVRHGDGGVRDVGGLDRWRELMNLGFESSQEIRMYTYKSMSVH